MTAAALLDRIAPIGLAELDDTAALLSRVDRKYLLPRADAALVFGLLPPGARVLEIGGRRDFGYSSTYFDSPALDFFVQSARGRRRRMKVRTRTYLDSGECWLEAKTHRRGVTVKDRVPRPGGEDDLTPADAEFLRASAHSVGITMVSLGRLIPVLDSAYRRTTLLLPGGVRVTMDADLRWTSRIGGGDRQASGWLVVETKGGPRASLLDRRLWAAGHRPIRISKYATGLAGLHPRLPHNRWARALGRLA
ncbi:MAG: polyphosphate polymerase domain-containing protein [Propionibacteriaceae bacterium]|nr:polyphosphate polymerase domain-containing protein [Propionibacteriaceae bacterium]